jgi:arylsulfatase A-like enzyme
MGIVPEYAKLTPRPKDFPAWDSLPPEKKRLYEKQMEVNAAMVSEADDQVGKIVAALKRTGQFDNTFIIVTSDNGPAGEGGPEGTFNLGYYYNTPAGTPFEVNYKYLDKWGGPETYPQYSAAWANLSSTPFFGFKQLLYEGGTIAPFIVHWPKGIKAKNGIRTQYHHFIDIAPTILDVTGVKFLDTVDGVKTGAVRRRELRLYV